MSDKVELDSELESFRRKWLSDLQMRNEHEAAAAASSSARPVARHHLSHRPPPPASPTASKKLPHVEHEDELVQTQSFDEPAPSSVDGPSDQNGDKELVSALDHYEEAMEKEAQGSMGDSLSLYRKAYRVSHH